MARLARVVCPGIPHHVTQRGNRRQEVFRSRQDSLEFIDLLKTNCATAGLSVWSWVLMTNHFHLVVVPDHKNSLAITMRNSLSDYALSFNRQYGFNGHLWQARFYSTALESDHLWNAVRYVERNPVRAGMVANAEEYPWSSAAFHCGLRSDDPLVSLASPLIGAIDEWAAWLALPHFDDANDQLRRNTRTGRPAGSRAFVRLLENLLEREIEPTRSS